MPEYMGYDRTMAMFSPDGRLFQVEYAKEAVKRGSTALGITFKYGIVLATVKPAGKLVVSEASEKIFQVDDHMAAVAAGFIADARTLTQMIRVKAQMHKITYDEPVDVWNIAKIIGNRMQLITQYGGLRPFGVSLLLGGVDKTGVHLLETDPSGTLFEWRAQAIGRGAILANKILNQKWKESLSEKEALELALDIIDKTERAEKKEGLVVDMAIIKKDARFKKINEDYVKSIK
ncbi:MAG: archaeal proteasome endopeptidase complex subunit alpha [Candidatus Aenigmarchaeota archaeon]|nr:archaeal proteasome endopeptidase complex subunit alpha [Candidatus Aenigmarchaeota archaeon]